MEALICLAIGGALILIMWGIFDDAVTESYYQRHGEYRKIDHKMLGGNGGRK